MSEIPVALISDWNGLAALDTCRALAHAGWSLLINGPPEDILQLQAEDFDGKVLATPFDPTDESSIQETILSGLEFFGRLDLVVNNFYNWQDAALHDISETLWSELWTGNLKATFHVSRAAALVMSEQQFGRIVQVTTTSCKTGSHLPFAAVGAAVHSLTRSLAKELAPFVRVNTVACGMLDEPWIDEGGPELRAMLQKEIPLGRLCRTQDVAEAIRFLATGADFMTGQMLVIDGGETVA